ncbi:MAG: two-component sensor histidine kinase, partial [Rhodospirillales bacterium]|nr:two-component sensor histidine kinase [Rhodospirillales bacterium]
MRARLPGHRIVKRLLPRSLLGRNLLMILIPLVLSQAVALQIFYGSHLDVVSRRLSGGIAGEIEFTLELMQRFPGHDNAMWILHTSRQLFTLEMRIEPGRQLVVKPSVNILGPMDDDLAQALEEKVRLPFTMDWTSDPRSVLIR